MADFDTASAIADQCLCFRARRTSRVLTRIYDEALRPLGLQATQLTLLSAVAMGEKIGASMGLIAETLGMDPTTLSRNLRPLGRSGLIRMAASGEDRRVRTACLSETGREMLSKAMPLWKQAHESVVNALGEEAAGDLRDRFDATVAATRR